MINKDNNKLTSYIQQKNKDKSYQYQLKENIERQIAIQSIIEDVKLSMKNFNFLFHECLDNKSNMTSANLSPILSNRTSPMNFRLLIQQVNINHLTLIINQYLMSLCTRKILKKKVTVETKDLVQDMYQQVSNSLTIL